MDNKAIKERAEVMLGIGYPKQQVFDSVRQEFPEAKPKKVAELVRYRPSLLARERYRGLHQLLLAAIAAYALLRVIPPLLETDLRWGNTYRLLSLTPIATVLLGYSVYRWQGQVFEWVGWVNLVNAFGLINGVSAALSGDADAWQLSVQLLSVLVGGLSLYLARRVFPKFTVEKDPSSTIPLRYVFQPEEGVVFR